METRDFLSAVTRICSDNECTDDCPVRFYCMNSLDKNTKDNIEKVEKVVEEWLKDHPVKTRQTEYKKVFPNCLLRDDGYPAADPCFIMGSYSSGDDCDKFSTCNECRKEFWNKVIE